MDIKSIEEVIKLCKKHSVTQIKLDGLELQIVARETIKRSRKPRMTKAQIQEEQQRRIDDMLLEDPVSYEEAMSKLMGGINA